MKERKRAPFTRGQLAGAAGVAVALPVALLHLKYRSLGLRRLKILVRKRLKEGAKLPLLGK